MAISAQLTRYKGLSRAHQLAVPSAGRAHGRSVSWHESSGAGLVCESGVEACRFVAVHGGHAGSLGVDGLESGEQGREPVARVVAAYCAVVGLEHSVGAVVLGEPRVAVAVALVVLEQQVAEVEQRPGLEYAVQFADQLSLCIEAEKTSLTEYSMFDGVPGWRCARAIIPGDVSTPARLSKPCCSSVPRVRP